jgi:predicted Zn-dependent peptidase
MPGRHAATLACHLAIPAAAEPDGLDGIAAVMAASLGTGARGIPARRLERETAAAGIIRGTRAGWTGPVITMELPARQLPAALDLLRMTLAEPALDPAEIAGQIQLAAAGLAGAAADPGSRALQELPAAVYGDGSRAGRPAAGTPAAIARLTPDAVAGFYDAQVRPAGTTIVIAGDLGGLDPAALAGEAFATWRDDRPAAGQGGGALPGPLHLENPASVLVHQDGAAQARLLLAVPAPGRAQPGRTALQIAAHILGAPITGRLDARIREQSGRSYALRAGLAEPVPGNGLLLVTGAVDGPSAPATLAEITGILAGPHRSGFTAQEHADAAQALTRTLPLTCETPGLLAALTADLAACGLPLGYLSLVLDDIAALTSSRVNDAYKSTPLTEKRTLIAVGDAAVLEGPLRELAGPAPLRVISA